MEAPQLDQDQVEEDSKDTLKPNVCRLCLAEGDKHIPIFAGEGLSNDLATKINLYLPITVSESDSFPLECCWACASTLLAWHELVVTSQECDQKFRQGGDKSSIGFDEDNVLATTSLNGFCQPPPPPALHPKKASSPKKRKQRLDPVSTLLPKKQVDDTVTYYQPEGTEPQIPLDSYMCDIEQHFIVDTDLDNEYKLGIDVLDIKSDNDNDEDEVSANKNPLSAALTDDNDSDSDGPASSVTAPAKRKRKNTKIDQVAANAAKVVVDGRVYYNCKQCGKSLHSPYTYIWHMRIHTGERPYVCDLCGKQFRVSQGLVRHLRETHEGIKKFACDLCGRMFATRRNVQEHRRIHTNERPYVCDLCGKAFKQKASLFVHKRSHKDVFPFACSYCNQGFRTKPPLMVHITRHTGEKPYKCEVCGRCFRIKYELKRHGLVHSDAKPFVCIVCGQSFRQKRYLRNHFKSNHPQNR